MRGNQFGKMFSLTTFGESHGCALGVVLDGVPAKLEFDINDLERHLSRRAPGRIPGTTKRKEEDQPILLSGVFEGMTLGSPIAVIVYNKDARSQDYDQLKYKMRPGHADQTTLDKFGIRDHRGGGRASGRETIGRVIGGYFAQLIIPNIECETSISQLGELNSKPGILNPPYFISGYDSNIIKDYLLKLQKRGDSVGGKISCKIKNVPPGLGEPVFDKLKADIAKGMLSIGSCIGITFGAGEDFLKQTGQEITTDKNHFGGIEGGITNGSDIYFECFFRPPSTVGKKALEGRHDPCILPRALVIVESMAMCVLADHFLRQKAYDGRR